MIKANNIHKYFGELHVLKGVHLEVKKGEIVSIVGASGAGKTTLLQILGTLLPPSNKKKSNLLINAEEISNLDANALAKFRNKYLGFIFQFHQLLPEFTALENVCIPAYIKGTTKPQAKAKAKELLAFLGLSERVDHKPSELSGGEQQRIAIARALLNDPELILADEPTGNLDPQTSVEVMKVLQDINQNGRTIIMATHDYALILKYPHKTLKCDGSKVFEVIQKAV